MSMNVNGVTGIDAATYANNNTTTKAAETKATEAVTDKKEESGVVYESSASKNAEKTTKTYKPDKQLVAKLKADADARTSQLRSLVEQLMGNQATKYGQATDIWSFLAKGDFTVDAATKAQAQKDIAEDGYWGVEKTSDRIIDFANALTGGDPSKVEEMREAFKKGYAQAEKKWGGELPDISKRTYEAVMDKFDKIASGEAVTTTDTN